MVFAPAEKQNKNEWHRPCHGCAFEWPITWAAFDATKSREILTDSISRFVVKDQRFSNLSRAYQDARKPNTTSGYDADSRKRIQ